MCLPLAVENHFVPLCLQMMAGGDWWLCGIITNIILGEMNITDNIIQAALLGTANRDIDFDGLPEALDGVMQAIQRAAHDREEAFYQAAAVAFASTVRRGGDGRRSPR